MSPGQPLQAIATEGSSTSTPVGFLGGGNRGRKGDRMQLRMHHTSGKITNFNTPNNVTFRHILHTYAKSHDLQENALDVSSLTYNGQQLDLLSTPWREGMPLNGAVTYWSMGLPDAMDDELSDVMAGAHVSGFRFDTSGVMADFGVEHPEGGTAEDDDDDDGNDGLHDDDYL